MVTSLIRPFPKRALALFGTGPKYETVGVGVSAGVAVTVAATVDVFDGKAVEDAAAVLDTTTEVPVADVNGFGVLDKTWLQATSAIARNMTER
jgi:hypothetical protein